MEKIIILPGRIASINPRVSAMKNEFDSYLSSAYN
jgi:hypothetical protein